MTNLERDMLIAKSDLELLSSVLVLLRPFCVIFPVRNGSVIRRRKCSRRVEAYFMISLSLMIFLISWIKSELTHTVKSISQTYLQ